LRLFVVPPEGIWLIKKAAANFPKVLLWVTQLKPGLTAEMKVS